MEAAFFSTELDAVTWKINVILILTASEHNIDMKPDISLWKTHSAALHKLSF
jgi:hypothetical protein